MKTSLPVTSLTIIRGDDQLSPGWHKIPNRFEFCSICKKVRRRLGALTTSVVASGQYTWS